MGKMKKSNYISYFLYLLFFTLIANGFILISQRPTFLIAFIPLFLFINIFSGKIKFKTASKRLKVCYHGAYCLFIFEISALISLIYHIFLGIKTIPNNYLAFIWSALICILTHFILFWNGIISVYLTSVQLGIKQRVIGIICGMIPIANLIALNGIIKTVFKEVKFETEKEEINEKRKEEQICKTKYPLLMVHGVFFRDSNFFNYWGRIPKELEKNGAEIYYGNHQSAASVEDSAKELTERIKEIVEETGCEKVNIIAHSKGGLDCRYAISNLDSAKYIASLTTINTPHRGCQFADYLLEKIPENLKTKVASTYNSTLRKFGEKNPDFMAAVNNLTESFCAQFDKNTPTPDSIFCQSVGSVLKKATGGKFPLNFSYHLVKYFDGDNDGLVSESSFEWGEKYTLLTPPFDRGISHGDIIDLNRENINGFDVREFYVQLVSGLKSRGL